MYSYQPQQPLGLAEETFGALESKNSEAIMYYALAKPYCMKPLYKNPGEIIATLKEIVESDSFKPDVRLEAE